MNWKKLLQEVHDAVKDHPVEEKLFPKNTNTAEPDQAAEEQAEELMHRVTPNAPQEDDDEVDQDQLYSQELNKI